MIASSSYIYDKPWRNGAMIARTSPTLAQKDEPKASPKDEPGT
ncbi:hypothetical protein [uncultured Campylobacter sp.]|nr:hypothetical protein [uncultured Campylobacter sp.]